MDGNGIISLSATAVAMGSLGVSWIQARTVRTHNRKSVRPHLQMRQVKNYGDRTTGLQVINVGLGPALITGTTVTLDGRPIGQWNKGTYETLAADWPAAPSMYALFDGIAFPQGACQYLIHLDEYDDAAHAWFWELICRRLSIVINYESFYGGENLRASPPPI
ncbi:hypothetical protein WKI68_37380 [Streptomyces sp. MS1.HAVA.3]|uniref:Uncharacterized protein n=1 Tax=Streptomyces caledonius TaxID=3134107 RepID=A0ABU8UBV3_9ACTN